MACCDTFEAAQASCTDAQELGSAVSVFHDRFHIGSISDLPPIRYCPWCGKDVTAADPLVAAAQDVVAALDSTKDWHELKGAIGTLAYVLGTINQRPKYPREAHD